MHLQLSGQNNSTGSSTLQEVLPFFGGVGEIPAGMWPPTQHFELGLVIALMEQLKKFI